MLFAAIFITIGPVSAMLQAGLDGPLAPLLQLDAGRRRAVRGRWSISG